MTKDIQGCKLAEARGEQGAHTVLAQAVYSQIHSIHPWGCLIFRTISGPQFQLLQGRVSQQFQYVSPLVPHISQTALTSSGTCMLLPSLHFKDHSPNLRNNPIKGKTVDPLFVHLTHACQELLSCIVCIFLSSKLHLLCVGPQQLPLREQAVRNPL